MMQIIGIIIYKKKHFINNSCEGYNSKLLRLFDYKKPSFWQNIQIIRNELTFKYSYCYLIVIWKKL